MEKQLEHCLRFGDEIYTAGDFVKVHTFDNVDYKGKIYGFVTVGEDRIPAIVIDLAHDQEFEVHYKTLTIEELEFVNRIE